MVRKKSSYDDLETDYFDEEVGGSFLSLMSLGVAFLAVAAFIALAWYAYQDDGIEEGEMETIYAQEGEIRTAPEGESGWQFPDTERQVYNLGNGDVEDMQAEQILPKPERPKAREVAEENAEGWINKPKTENKESTIGITDAERRKLQEIADANIQKAPEVVVEAKKEVEQVVEKTEKVEDAIVDSAETKQVVEKVETKPAPQPVETTTSTSLTSHRLQLGAFGSRSEALKNWSKIQTRSGSLLDGKKAHIEAAEVKGKIYYRVHAYPFDSKASADALCVMLKSRNQPCFSVKR